MLSFCHFAYRFRPTALLPPNSSFNAFGQAIQEALMIRVIPEQKRLPGFPVPYHPARYMVDRPWKFNSQMSHHAHTMAWPILSRNVYC